MLSGAYLFIYYVWKTMFAANSQFWDTFVILLRSFSFTELRTTSLSLWNVIGPSLITLRFYRRPISGLLKKKSVKLSRLCHFYRHFNRPSFEDKKTFTLIWVTTNKCFKSLFLTTSLYYRNKFKYYKIQGPNSPLIPKSVVFKLYVHRNGARLMNSALI